MLIVSCGGETSPTPTDRFPPEVSIVSPAAGVVTGTVTLTANATDDVGITVVEWRVNSALLPAPDSTAPYEHSWNTALYGPGTYSWAAVARDDAGKVTESVLVTYQVTP
jgi:hypothetical protein